MTIKGLALRKLQSNDPSLYPSERNNADIYIKIIQVIEAKFQSNSPNH